MPDCVLCGSQQFDVLDGLYFCNQCGTQSQDIREEVQACDTLLDNRMRVRRKSHKKPKKELDCGKPWFTLEGYQVLLKAQVEYLVKIGVNAKLKDVVGQMWFRYVELSSDAFKSDVWQLRHYVHLKKRDDLKDFVPFDSIPRPPRKEKRGFTQEEDEALELSSEIAREDFYEDDDPTGGLFERDDNSEDDNDQNLSSYSDSNIAGSVYLSFTRTRRCAGYTTLVHTLVLCYLGLLWLQEPICVSDLLRWARDGQFPLLNAASYFPSYMKFSQTDCFTFCGSVVPTKRRVYALTTRMKGYLSLPDLPLQGVGLYAARYLVDLQLPAHVHRVASTIIKVAAETKVKPTKDIIFYDDLAMAYIIFSLKLIYGLDGKTESNLDGLVQECSSEKNRPDFPAWADIVEVVYACQTAVAEHGIPWSTEEFKLLKDYRNYGQFCRENVFGSWKPPRTVLRYSKSYSGSKGLSEDKQAEYAKMFAMLMPQTTEMVEKPFVVRSASSFPLLGGRTECLKKYNSHFVPVSSRAAVIDPFKQTTQRGIPAESILSYYEKREDAASKRKDASDIEEDKSPKSTMANDAAKGGSQFSRYDSLRWNFMHRSIIEGTQRFKDIGLPESLSHFVEMCSRLIETEPAVLFSKVQELEKELFQGSN